TFLWARRFLAAREQAREQKRRRDDVFMVDSLEERILLSADPALGPPDTVLAKAEEQRSSIELVEHWDISQQETQAEIQLSQTAAKIVYDIEGLESHPPAMDSALVISAGEILAGSGSLDIDLINEGTLAPGHSPGVQNFTSLSQESSGTLEIEIAGTGAAGASDGYDQLNVTNLAQFDGTLEIKLLNGFTPNAGDTFDILSHGSFSGKFDELKGGYGFSSDLYFDIEQSSTKTQLVVREVVDDNHFALDLSTEEQNQFGSFLNSDVLEAGSELQLNDTAFQYGDFFSSSGDFIFKKDSGTVTLSDGKTASVDLITIGSKGSNSFFGSGGGTANAFGFKLDNSDFGIAVSDEQGTSDRQWVSLKVTAASPTFSNLPTGMSYTGTDGVVEINEADSDGTVIDYSSSSRTVDTSDSSSIDLSMAGDDGDLSTITSTANLSAHDLYKYTGSLAIHFDTEFITVNTGLKKAEATALQSTITDLTTNHGAVISDDWSQISNLKVLSLKTVYEGITLTNDGTATVPPSSPTDPPPSVISISDSVPRDKFAMDIRDIDLGFAMFTAIASTPMLSFPTGVPLFTPLDDLPVFTAMHGKSSDFDLSTSAAPITFDGTEILVDVNLSTPWKDRTEMGSVDFLKSFPASGTDDAGLEITGSSATVALAQPDTRLMLLGLKDGLIKSSDYKFETFGDFQIEYKGEVKVSGKSGLPTDLSSNSDLSAITTDLNQLKTGGYLSSDYQNLVNLPTQNLVISGNDTKIFVGNGPYFQDSNNDSKITREDTPNDDAFGISLDKKDIGLSLFLPKEIENVGEGVIPVFIAAKVIDVDANTAKFGPFTASIEEFTFHINKAAPWKDSKIFPNVDFKSSFSQGYEISLLGDTNTISLDYDTQKLGATLKASISIEKVITLKGILSFQYEESRPL
ncbi:LEPR-XLL domain-containing protein, partial [bacterium]|nr:LEPR-XLL domain-containing protein [bacterium]